LRRDCVSPFSLRSRLMVFEARSGRLYGLNASGWAPEWLTPAWLRGRGLTNMPQGGIDSVTVPIPSLEEPAPP